MNYLPKSPTKDASRVGEPLAGGEVMNISQPGKDDLSDWVELMEAVEALCPVWPPRERRSGGRDYKL
jgi:hypothetical protein